MVNFMYQLGKAVLPVHILSQRLVSVDTAVKIFFR